VVSAGAGGTWSNYDSVTGVTTTKKVKIQNDLEVTGVTTSTGGFVGALTGNVSGNIAGATGSFTGNVSVGGTLTYEDVTNIDSVGLVTARTGVRVNAGGLVVTAGVSTLAADLSIADKIIHTGDTNTAIRFPAADTFTVETAGSERLRATSAGLVGINSTIPRSKLHVANGSSNYNPGNPTGLGAGAVASLESSGDVALQFLTSTSTDNFIYFGDTDSATTGSIQYDHNVNALMFNANGGTERLRIAAAGQIGLGGANYGTSGQVILSNGSGSAPTWGDAGAAGLTTEALVSSGIVTTLNLTAAQDHKVTASGITPSQCLVEQKQRVIQ